ncbi:MAG: 30S ribosomal protein S5 [Candidatus Harrisonbacteria bacterium]|nr:30S ribosomal protein S5 [Candidatus Harrisonbacteria bacterium]
MENTPNKNISAPRSSNQRSYSSDRGPSRDGARGPRRFGDKKPAPFIKTDGFKEKVIDMRRVTRVVAGGKRFRFRATIIIGDEKGQVGVGIAKGADVAQAVDKAKTAAKKALIRVGTKGTTIIHEVSAKFGAARVMIKPAPVGHGLRAGGSSRVVLAMAGIKDAIGKTLGSTTNKLTNAIATIHALEKIKVKPAAPKEKVALETSAPAAETK